MTFGSIAYPKVIFTQSAEPSNKKEGLLWYDTDDGKLYSADGVNYNVIGSLTSPTFDISNATTDGSVNIVGQVASSEGVYISPDGINMYVISTTAIFQYTLSTAWDISSAAYATKTISISGQDSTSHGLCFNPTGTKFYTTGYTSDAVWQYDLSTAWDLSTAAYANKTISVAGQSLKPIDLVFDPTGTKMYVVAQTEDAVFQYTLSTAWDVSTATYDAGKTISVAGTPEDLFLNDTGTKLYVLQTNTITQYTLSTAWDISTATADSLTYTTVAAGDTGLFFNAVGNKFYTCNHTTDLVYGFDTTVFAKY